MSNLKGIVSRSLDRAPSGVEKTLTILDFFPQFGNKDSLLGKAFSGDCLKGEAHILVAPNYEGRIRDYDRRRAPFYAPSLNTLDVSSLEPGQTYMHRDRVDQEAWEMVVLENRLDRVENRVPNPLLERVEVRISYLFIAVRKELLDQY